MKTQELREHSVQELEQLKADLLREQFNLRMQRGMGESPRTHCFSRVRKDIARINTIITEKEASL